ncbi:mechanosensitive ion channel protein 1, mitochondrial [Selaginella moellendorffii]|uniref:mechanosensitive ion channel protein 1, mitochondrial n=1 Tax=Selaginella moellendorffii TaxID=88036 RepID=UPI000D1CA1CA|nr:mechanosensitive ion channel protein 1, mitochondrial [Selaginella moellendorffii]|eukprot:XP_024517944.1 mechanosensitive ion channel protein 1, mitochondrial [Selaginella moellendorffii]
MVDHLASKSRIDAPRVVAIDKVASLFLYFLAASSIAEVCGFALSSLLAVGGISGLAVGLAAKEIVSNVFGGAILFMTRPFVIGERIKAGSFSGEVQDIGFLQTKLLGFDKVPVLVPNQAFINQPLFSSGDYQLLQGKGQAARGNISSQKPGHLLDREDN